MSKVLKAKYYYDENFLSTGLCGNPSMIWRSIWESRDLLVKGCRVKIGKGREVNVWNASWLPCPDDGKVSSEGGTCILSYWWKI